MSEGLGISSSTRLAPVVQTHLATGIKRTDGHPSSTSTSRRLAASHIRRQPGLMDGAQLVKP